MIGKLTGTIDASLGNPVIMDVAGVGYLVHIPKTVPTTTATLFIHTYVREDALDLYGFATTDDLALFKLLLTVSGIGPKTAVLVMDKGAHAIEKAIRESDVDFFTAIPRLGKKNAQKLIIELKTKLGSLRELNLKEEEEDEETDHLIDALASMGFARKEVLPILKRLDKTQPIEQKIRHALKLLAK